jgi:hypothetical protein
MDRREDHNLVPHGDLQNGIRRREPHALVSMPSGRGIAHDAAHQHPMGRRSHAP